MNIINKIKSTSEPILNYQQLVCDKLNELTTAGFFLVSNRGELVSHGQCANIDFTIAFGIISALCVNSYSDNYGYFCFGYSKAPVSFRSSNWKEVWNAIKDVTKNTTITIS